MADLMSLPTEVHELILRELLYNPGPNGVVNDILAVQNLSPYWSEVIDKLRWEEFHSIGVSKCDCWACQV